MKNQILIKKDHKLASMEHFYGAFFEDISNAGDGGLYGELIQNRAFEFSPMDDPSYHGLTRWEIVAEDGAKISCYVSNKDPFCLQNPHYLVMDIECAKGIAGIKNLGFHTGIPVEKGKQYDLCFCARSESPMPLCISLESASNKAVYAQIDTTVSSTEWKKYEFSLTSSDTDHACHLMIRVKKEGKLFLDFVSLFPKDTFRNRKNGLRKDLAEMIEELHPRFLRFPGGCLIHVGSLNENDRDSMYRWKNTLGDIEKRPVKSICWRGNQTFGIGYYEYFLFCEDIGAEPIPVLPAGYNPHTKMAIPLDEMQPWIDDALDLIEFANGDINSKWGAYRASLGHAKPFHLKYLSIGNEEEGEGFWDRYDLIHKAVRKRYPDIKLINTAGWAPEGEDYERGWKNAIKNASDLVDEHYYMPPEWFLQNCHRYDAFDRKNPCVFLGEYSSSGNTWFHALAEAVYMVHLEKNADIVKLVCYAPLLCNVNHIQWNANLIFFNQYQAYGTPNYYVNKLFMNHCGTHLLQVETNLSSDKVLVKIPDTDKKTVDAVRIEPLHITASIDEQDSSIIVKVVNISDQAICANLIVESCTQLSGMIYEMKGYDSMARNTMEQPDTIVPKQKTISIDQANFSYQFDGKSITVFQLYEENRKDE